MSKRRKGREKERALERRGLVKGVGQEGKIQKGKRKKGDRETRPPIEIY